MKIIIYSDLHLEFGTEFQPPADSKADLMILAGDIISFRDFRPLERLLDGWNKERAYHVLQQSGQTSLQGSDQAGPQSRPG